MVTLNNLISILSRTCLSPAHLAGNYVDRVVHVANLSTNVSTRTIIYGTEDFSYSEVWVDIRIRSPCRFQDRQPLALFDRLVIENTSDSITRGGAPSGSYV